MSDMNRQEDKMQNIFAIIYQAEKDLSKAMGFPVAIKWEPVHAHDATTSKLHLLEVIVEQVCGLLDQPQIVTNVRSRKRDLVECRQIIAYLAYRVYKCASARAVGIRLGGKDHSTIIHSCEQVESLMFSDRFFRQKVELCKAEVDIIMQVKSALV